MGKPVTFPEQTTTLNPPPGAENEVIPMPVQISDDGFVTSCWRLSKEEIAEVVATGRVWVTSMGVPKPVLISGVSPFKTYDLVDISAS